MICKLSWLTIVYYVLCTLYIHTFRNTHCLTTQYAPSCPIYCAFVAIQLKDSIGTILEPATREGGADCGYHTMRYHNLWSFARQTSFCGIDHPSVQLLSPRAVWWRVGSACGSTTTLPTSYFLLYKKNGHQLVTRCDKPFLKGF